LTKREIKELKKIRKNLKRVKKLETVVKWGGVIAKLFASLKAFFDK
jgi:hypothetical protein